MRKLLVIVMIALCSGLMSQPLRDKQARKINLRIEKEKDRNHLFEGVIVGYGVLFTAANFSQNTNKFIIPAFIITGVGISTLIKTRKRKHGVQCI